jgi:zinc D-Ala-D-Ala dipeptidase
MLRRICIAVCAVVLAAVSPAFADALRAGFVRLADVDATIRQDMRYAGTDNFMHRKVAGYDAPVCILTDQAAKALSKVQKAVAAEGLGLVVFDCYRPVRAVDDMVAWTKQRAKVFGGQDTQWYPKTRRGDLISKGYVGARSAHSRGSTVDLAFVPLSGVAAASPDCGARDAGTLDFGTGFDCFDPRSQTKSAFVGGEAMANREKLLAAMTAQGFRNYADEWWHFTLEDEPFAKQRFDFPVTAE